MYLSEFTINLGRRDGRELVSSPQRLHGAVLGCFPPGQSSSESRTLWRLDRARDGARLMVSSPIAPDFQGLTEAAGWDTGTSYRTVHYSSFLDRLEQGQVWRFRLAANPTVSLKDPKKPGSRGRRVPYDLSRMQPADGEQRPSKQDWLANRADRIGVTFELGAEGVQQFQLTERRKLEFTKGAAGHRVTIALAQFDGLLRIVDPELLRAALIGGIGPARAYGCGLMTLAPANA